MTMIRRFWNFLRRALHTLRSEGALVFAFAVINKVLSPLGEINVGTLFERDLAVPLPPMKARVGIRIDEATEDDVMDLVKVRHGKPTPAPAGSNAKPIGQAVQQWLWAHAVAREAYDIAITTDYLRRGNRCFLARIDGEIVHMNWLCTRWGSAITGYLAVLGEGDVYTDGCFTVTAHRGKHIHDEVMVTMLHAAQQAGARKAYTVTWVDTWRATTGLRRLGYEVQAKLLYLKFPRLGLVKLIALRGSSHPLSRMAWSS